MIYLTIWLIITNILTAYQLIWYSAELKVIEKEIDDLKSDENTRLLDELTRLTIENTNLLNDNERLKNKAKKKNVEIIEKRFTKKELWKQKKW